jgi:hypothetical protein
VGDNSLLSGYKVLSKYTKKEICVCEWVLQQKLPIEYKMLSKYTKEIWVCEWVSALTEVTQFGEGGEEGCLSVGHRYSKNHIPALGFLFIALTLITSYNAYSLCCSLKSCFLHYSPLLLLHLFFLLDVPSSPNKYDMTHIDCVCHLYLLPLGDSSWGGWFM